jgi:hypothetical protein
MSLKARLAEWYIRRRIVKAVKGALKMKPLPKWVGMLSLLGSIGSLLGAMGGVLPPKYAVICATAATFLSNLSHSLPGTGGKPQ